MKGIILAAGKGTTLYPATVPVCKPLLNVYDKPMIYYPLSLLIDMGIREILIITPPGEMEPFVRLFGDGEDLGVHISYKEQKAQRGIADAIKIGKWFIGDDKVCLALGDNIFYHEKLLDMLVQARDVEDGAAVFGYYVEDPRPFGVVEFDKDGKAISIEEKPRNPKSNYIIPGLYFYDNSVIDIVEHLRPSERGELEITDVNLAYLRKGKLHVVSMGQHVKWMDADNPFQLLYACNTTHQIQKETGKLVGCPEESALRAGFITKKDVSRIGSAHRQTPYGTYLLKL
jgi:glucose-1-phosphate thymidylyltransferase